MVGRSERQKAALCGQHCLNNLLQGPYFTEGELAEIAHELDSRERALMFSAGTETAEAIAYAAEESGNVDDSGNFSVEARPCCCNLSRCFHLVYVCVRVFPLRTAMSSHTQVLKPAHARVIVVHVIRAH